GYRDPQRKLGSDRQCEHQPADSGAYGHGRVSVRQFSPEEIKKTNPASVRSPDFPPARTAELDGEFFMRAARDGWGSKRPFSPGAVLRFCEAKLATPGARERALG